MWKAFVPASGDSSGYSCSPALKNLQRGPRPGATSEPREDKKDEQTRREGEDASKLYRDIISEGDTNTVAEAPPDNPQAVFGPVPNPNLPARKGFYCDVCGEHISSMSEEQHRSSTLHIFNRQHPSRSRKIQLDESNKGFRMLAGMGWNVDEGLGAHKQVSERTASARAHEGNRDHGTAEPSRTPAFEYPRSGSSVSQPIAQHWTSWIVPLLNSPHPGPAALFNDLLRDAQGRVNPLRTTFKTDTTGLGAGPKLRPRVTHFPSHVPSQARNSADGKSDAIRAHESLEHRNGRRRGEVRGWARDRGIVRNADQGNSAPGGVQGDHGARQSRKRGRISSDGTGHNPRRGGSCSSLASGDEEHRGSVDDGERGCRGDGVHGHGKGSTLGRGKGSGGIGDSDSEEILHRLGEKRSVHGKKRVLGAGSGVFMSRAERKAGDKAKHRSDRRWRMELLSDIPDEFQALFNSD